jgi:putative two-component system response regulator
LIRPWVHFSRAKSDGKYCGHSLKFSPLLIRSVRQNRVPFIVLLLSFAFFLTAIIYGGRLIYRIEADALSAHVAPSLNKDAKTVKDLFLSCTRDLIFIKRVPGLTECLSAPGRGKQGKYARDLLLRFAMSHPNYSRIRFIDNFGKEQLSIENNFGTEPSFVLDSLLQDRRMSDYYLEGIRLGENGVYSMFTHKDTGETEMYSGRSASPAIIIASPFFDADGSKAGVIVLDISLRKLLENLSNGAFLQDQSGMLIALQGNGGLAQQESPYSFTGTGGTIGLSDTESVPYLMVEYLPGHTVWMGRHFSSSPFKKSMIKLEVISVSIFATFFLSVLVLGVINVRNFWNVDTAQKAIIHSLANLSEWRDPETGSHLERTRNFSVLLAKTLRKRRGLRNVVTDDFIEALYDSVPLHDIGKVGIRDDILLKSARLSPDEFEVMKNHVLIGRDIIQDIIDRFGLSNAFLIVSRNVCYCHHEKYDGTGYPGRLKGDDIPIEARIFAICDVYDALRAKRPYKPGLSHREALETIMADRGRHFDPAVVDALLECSDQFYEIFEVYKLFDDTYGKLMNVRSKDALKIAWTEELSVGDITIDSQHREFIERVNSFFAGVLMGEGKREALRQINFLYDYAVHHFNTEEELMETQGFPDLTSHKSQHEEFLHNLAALKKDIKSSEGVSSTVVVRVNAKVVYWLMDHILETDKKLETYVRSAQGRNDA